jgi:hypothetical protein
MIIDRTAKANRYMVQVETNKRLLKQELQIVIQLVQHIPHKPKNHLKHRFFHLLFSLSSRDTQRICRHNTYKRIHQQQRVVLEDRLLQGVTTSITTGQTRLHIKFSVACLTDLGCLRRDFGFLVGLLHFRKGSTFFTFGCKINSRDSTFFH